MDPILEQLYLKNVKFNTAIRRLATEYKTMICIKPIPLNVYVQWTIIKVTETIDSDIKLHGIKIDVYIPMCSDFKKFYILFYFILIYI